MGQIAAVRRTPSRAHVVLDPCLMSSKVILFESPRRATLWVLGVHHRHEEPWGVPVARNQAEEFVEIREPGQDGRIRDLVAIEVQDQAAPHRRAQD